MLCAITGDGSAEYDKRRGRKRVRGKLTAIEGFDSLTVADVRAITWGLVDGTKSYHA